MKRDLKFLSKRPLPLSMWLAGIAAGFMMSLPISGFGGTDRYTSPQPPENQVTSERAAQRDSQLLRDELEFERREMTILEKALIDEKSYAQDLLTTVQRYRELAGMTDLTGPGIIISISENDETIPGDTTPKSFIIHQEDLLNIINELWHNDAEAIAVGSAAAGGTFERVVNFSPVKCSGGAIIINDRRMVPPFEIRAVGDPDLLKTVISMRGGFLDNLIRLGILVDVETSENVYIPKYNGTTHWLYGRTIMDPYNVLLPELEESGGDSE